MSQIGQQTNAITAGIPEIPALAGLWEQLSQISGSTLKVWLWLGGHLAPEGADLPLGPIQGDTGLARSTVIRALADLIRRGVICAQGRPGVATRYRWAAPALGAGEGEGRVVADDTAPATATRPLSTPVVVTYPAGTRPICGPGQPAHPASEPPTDSKNERVGVGPDPLPSPAPPRPRQETPDSPAEPISFCAELPVVNRIESKSLLTLERETESSPAGTAGGSVPAELTTQITLWSHTLQPGAGPRAAKATRTRALRLWQQSAQTPADFSRLLEVAGQRTLGRMGQAGGRPVRCPISYFFQVLIQLVTALPPVSALPGAEPQISTLIAATPVSPGLQAAKAASTDTLAVGAGTAGLASADPPEVAASSMPERRSAPPAGLWRQALVRLRLQFPDDYERVLRYAQLVDLQPMPGQSRIVVPSEWMRRQIVERLIGPISTVLTALTSQGIQVQVGLH